MDRFMPFQCRETQNGCSAHARHADSMADAASSHLVMAVAWGYRLEVYQVFVLSLRRAAQYTGDVALLAPARNKTRLEALALLDTWRVNLIEFSSLPGLNYRPHAMVRTAKVERRTSLPFSSANNPDVNTSRRAAIVHDGRAF